MNFVNAFKRGDLCWSAQFLRKLGGEHTLYCRMEYADHLPEMFSGTSITIAPIDTHPKDCIDLWIGSGSNPVNWYSEGCPKDLIAFLMKFFNGLGFGEVFTERHQFLADYPALLPAAMRGPHGALVIDANPESSQCPGYVPEEMDDLVARLANKHSVKTVKGAGMSFSEIGRRSQFSEFIVAVATGPIWPTFNIWNKETPRHILLDGIELDFGIPAEIRYHTCVKDLRNSLENLCLL